MLWALLLRTGSVADAFRESLREWLMLLTVDDRAEGDAEDPLLGVIRVEADGQRGVDVVVGRCLWQPAAVARAKPLAVCGVLVPAVTAADLVQLELYAGGSQDCWDIEQLLADAGTPAIVAGVDARVSALPARAGQLWQRLRPKP